MARANCDRIAALIGPRIEALGYPEALGYIGVTTANVTPPTRRARTTTETLLDVAKGLQKKVSLPKLI